MKYRVWLVFLIIFALCFSACDMLPKPAGQAGQDAPTATPIPQSAAQERPTATPQPAGDAGGGAGDEKPGGEVGDYGELKSYRLYAKKTDQENGQVSETTTACVLDPFALHTISQGGDGSMEMIAVDNTVSTVRIEHQATEINEPIAIEPPEGAIEMGSGIMPDMDDPSLPTDDQDDEALAAALDDLSSYRLERTVTVKQDDGETQNTYLFEWIKEPPIYRSVVDMMEMTFEHLWAGDKVWTRMGGGDWIEISADEAPDPLDNLGDVMGASEGMTPDGEETVNGIRCKCYITEMTMPQATGFHRICIADQAGIPPLVIYGLMQIEQQGITTITESNLYDVNQPFTIETPE